MLRKVARSPAAACAAAGAALALCLPRPGLCWLAWFAPALLLLRLRRSRGPRAAAALGWVFGAVYAAVALHWVYLTCRFAGVPVPAAVLALAALAAFLGIQWAVFGAWVRVSADRLPAAVLPWVWAASWAGMEWASARFTPRLGIDLLAYTQWRHLPMIQVGALLGPQALGFLIVLWNGALAELGGGRPGRALRRNLAAAAALAALCAAYGTAVLAGRRDRADGPTVDILQPNIDQYRKWDRRYEEEIRRAFDGLLTEAAQDPPDLVLWPESALPGWLEDPALKGWVASWARRLKAPMLVGAVSGQGGRLRNAAVLVGADGAPAGAYYKRQLVPFGEFVPFRAWLEGFIGILAELGDFEAGAARQALLPSPVGPLGISICYEAVFPRWARQDVSRGAEVLVNLTNDGWYKDTWGPHQHFYANVFRAVENRVFVLRAANTGVSGVIDPYGVVTARTPLEAARRLRAALPAGDPFPRRSPYARWGDWFGIACAAAAAAALAGALRRR